jgi:hypothetical protein
VINFESKVGTELEVVMRGAGFCREDLGQRFEVLAYSPTGYAGREGYLCVEGTNEMYNDWVGAQSFFDLQGEDYE